LNITDLTYKLPRRVAVLVYAMILTLKAKTKLYKLESTYQTNIRNTIWMSIVKMQKDNSVWKLSTSNR